jgi:hypothetical protein
MSQNPFEEHQEFWASLLALDDSAETAEVVNALVDRAVKDPLATPPRQDGVRVIRSPKTEKNGRTFRALRLAYTAVLPREAEVGIAEEVAVVLLQVTPYDEATETREAWMRDERKQQQ